MDIADIKDEELKRCAEFHGHICPGLTIGFRAAQYAKKLLELTFSEDEDVVCVSENDACGVDAIQVLLGCSAGKGNLLFHMRGKQAFSFYNRKTGKSVRLVLKADKGDMERDEWQQELMAIAKEKGDQAKAPALADFEEICKAHDIPFGPDRELVGLAISHGMFFLKEKDGLRGEYFLRIAHGLTKDPKIGELLQAMEQQKKEAEEASEE